MPRFLGFSDKHHHFSVDSLCSTVFCKNKTRRHPVSAKHRRIQGGNASTKSSIKLEKTCLNKTAQIYLGYLGYSRKHACIWMFPKIVVPQNGWFTIENPMNKMDDLGGGGGGGFPIIFGSTSIYWYSRFNKANGSRSKADLMKLKCAKNHLNDEGC